MPTGAELFAASLQQLGIDVLFTLVGDHLNEALLAVARHGIRVIDMRHESGVTHAADAYARLRRKPAASLVTGGPGHTNSLTGIATAYLAASPLIAISGAPAAALAGRQVFQAIDQVGMTQPVVKWAAAASGPAQIPYLLGRAYAEASAGRMGPVHLTIPVDAFTAHTDSPLPLPAPPARGLSMGDIEPAIELLRSAERPVVIAGSGVWWGHAEKELDRFIKRTRLPLFTVTMARGAISDTARNVFGYADPAINPAVRRAFPEADVVLVLGKRIDYRLALGGPRLFSPDAAFAQIDLHSAELGANRPLAAGICADLAPALAAMSEAVGKEGWKPRTAWLRRLRQYTEESRAGFENCAQDQCSPMHPAAFFAGFRRACPPGVLYSWDGGDFVHWGRAMTPAVESGGWLRLGPMGTIGSAVPNALALKLMNPGKPVVMITGDGSLGFYLAELETFVRYNVPVVMVVGNDGGWGLERELQREITGGDTVACELQRTRYDVIMKGFGGEGETIDRIDQVGPAVTRAFQSNKPYLLNVQIRGVRSPFTDWQVLGKRSAPPPSSR